jgi:protein O-mannosyl-transferase
MKKKVQKSNKVGKELKIESKRNKLSDFINNHFNLISIILIILAGIIVYSNSFDCTFHLDDRNNIQEKPLIQNLSNFTNINFWLHPARQIAYLSFAINYHYNKLDVFGYHLINIIFHIITGIFTFFLIKLMLKKNNSKDEKFNNNKNWIALFSALLFIVHPLQTQAITYIVQRMASMAAMFYIISIYFYAIGRIEHSQKNNTLKALTFYVLALISGFMAVMTKENSATFPFAMLLFEFFFIRDKKNKIYKNYIIISFLTIIGICILYLLLNPTILTSGASEGINISGIDYLINEFVVIVRYLQLIVLPVNQSADYGNVNYGFPFVKSFWRFDIIGCLSLLVGLIVLAIYLYKKNKILSFSIFWFFLTLSVESSIIPIADPMFEHRMYLPMLGVGLLLVSSLFLILNKLRPIFVFSFLSVIVITMGITCYSRNEIWKNDLSLWSDVINKTPYNARGWHNKGWTLEELGKNEEAIQYFDKAILLKPDYFSAWYNKGLVYKRLGKYDEAIKYYDEAIKIKPDFDEAWNNKGTALYNLKRNEEALKCYSEAINLNPSNFEAYNNEGSALISLGKFDESIEFIDKSIKMKQDYFEAWNNKGLALANLKKYDESIKCFDESIKIKPDYIDAWYDRGTTFFFLERYGDAIYCYDKVLGLNPNHSAALSSKNIALEKLKK